MHPYDEPTDLDFGGNYHDLSQPEEAAEQDAPRPDPATVARFLDACSGDDTAAHLCATADEAADRALAAMDALHEAATAPEGLRSALDLTRATSARERARAARDAARADVRQYFGDTLGDQPAPVLRAAGFRV